jgi:arsenite-transporting ATPase
MPDLGYEPKEILPNLQALQIDPLTEMNRQYTTILSYIASLFHARGIDETLAYELAMLPGMTQLFSLLKIEEVARMKTFDTVVLDMAASGEALRYLYFPKLVGSIGRKLTGLVGMFSGFARIFQPLSKLPTPPQSVMQNELELLARLDELNMIMRNQDMTSIRLVANPDTFSIENAKRAFMSASLYGINVDLAIINKIMPTGSSDLYYAEWANFQRMKIEEAKSNFYPLPVKEVKLHGIELRGIEMLRENGQLMFENQDPADVLFRGNAFRFATEDSLLRMTVKVPFTEKDDFDVERHGDQLTIKVKNRVGYLVNTVPLPVATMGMKLAKAKLQGDELIVLFERIV